MTLQYFKYDTNFGNTIVDKSDTSFAPAPPYGEVLLDFSIPDIQPLYLYCVSGEGAIVVNTQENVDAYLVSIQPAPTPDNNVTYAEYSATTALQNEIINTFTGTTGLQQVTAINALTNVESTFNGGLKTSHIRPTGDTITAIQIRKADGTTALISIDSLSGLTGFNITAPKGVVHAYGNNPDTDGEDTQKNAVIIDGSSDVDKDIQWAENGQAKWLAETYRDENADFWYLYNVESGISPITVKESGRIGFNKNTNIMDDHATQIVGTGLSDIVISGEYTQSYNTVYMLMIVGNGTPDIFEWRKSINGGVSYSAWSSPSGITTTPLELEYGVCVEFTTLTGHTVGNIWLFAAFTQIPEATVTIAPMGFAEILVTNDYTESVPSYYDMTALGNGAVPNGSFPFKGGSGATLQALVWGTPVDVSSVYMNFVQGGESLSLVLEYWNGSSWVALSPTTNFLLDGTNNGRNSGRIIWEINTFPWVKSLIPGDSTELYWMRLRTSTVPTIAPIGKSMSVGNDKRFAIFDAYNSINSNMYVDSLGRMNVGGGVITRKNKLQINSEHFLDVAVGSGSLVEMDSSDASASDLRIKLVSNDACSTGIAIVKTRGEIAIACGVQTGDELGHIWFRARVGTTGATLNSITSQYTGNGDITSICGDLIFNTAGGQLPIERVRINYKGNTGFGITPTAVVTLKAGTTSNAPLKFTSGSLLTTPEAGAMEFLGNKAYLTTTGGTRHTLAFLESPIFTGNPQLPSGTTLVGQSLCNLILNSGGTNNTCLVKTTAFNTYTGSTQLIISKAITGATNGITKTDCHNICLGGTLTSALVLCGNQDICLQGKRIDIASSCGAQIYDKNGCGIEFYSSGGTTTIKGMTSSGVESMRFQISNTQATFTDSRAVPHGVEYNADYSSTFTSRSFVDKEYVDTHAGGLFPKASVVVATTAPVTLSGLSTIGGVTLTNGMRVLVKNQASGQTNGVYTASSGAWSRATDFDSSTEVVNGSYFFITSGATNQNTSWILSTANPITVGTTVLTFTLFAQSNGVSAGNGICVTQTGGNFNIAAKLASNCGLCNDASGLYVNSSIAGTGLQYTTGVINLDGSSLAGNSLSWTGTQFAVNITGGTLNTALNSKLAITAFNTYSGVTLTNINTRALKTSITTYTGTTAPATYVAKTIFTTYTGTTAPATYVSKSAYNTYTGATATAIGLKANITSPTFLVSAFAPKAIQNDNSTCIATTSWYISQGATALPLMNSTAACGTSNLFARQDHVHASDTSRQATITGGASTITSSNLTADRALISDGSGKVAVSTITTSQLAAVVANVYGTEYQLASALASTTTTSTTPIAKVTMTTTNLPAGTYKVMVAWVWSRDSISNSARFNVTVGGVAQGTRTTMEMEAGDVTDVRPESRVFYLALSGVNTIVFNHWSEVSNTTTTSDATIELIRVA